MVLEGSRLMRNHFRIFVVLALALACAAPGWAQRKEKKEDANVRNLQGMVTSPEDKPVPGAVVQLKDMRTLQVRSFITQAEGDYHFSGLKTDIDYEVKASFSGLSSDARTLSVFDNRKNAVINLKLKK
jgi:hypothetical protein